MTYLWQKLCYGDERTKLFGKKKKEVSRRLFSFSHKFYGEEKYTFIIKKITYFNRDISSLDIIIASTYSQIHYFSHLFKRKIIFRILLIILVRKYIESYL